MTEAMTAAKPKLGNNNKRSIGKAPHKGIIERVLPKKKKESLRGEAFHKLQDAGVWGREGEAPPLRSAGGAGVERLLVERCWDRKIDPENKTSFKKPTFRGNWVLVAPFSTLRSGNETYGLHEAF